MGQRAEHYVGYYKNETATREVFSDDGWFRTGDLGVFDRSGWLSHKGRLKNLIVGANGENIYPEEIESLINNFRNVVDSVVLQKNGKLVALVHLTARNWNKNSGSVGRFTHKVDEKSGSSHGKLIPPLKSWPENYINTSIPG
jgi:long-chain acyl-CoA synthetase